MDLVEAILYSMTLNDEWKMNLQKDDLNWAGFGMTLSVKGEYSITGYSCCFECVPLKLG